MKYLYLLPILLLFSILVKAQSSEIIAVPFNHEWQFNDNSGDLTLRYNLPFFEDSPFYNDDDWTTANAPFGFGHTVNTEIKRNTDSTETPLTSYFLADEPMFLHFSDQINEMFVTVRYDDAFILYINGVEVARRNLFPISFSGTAATNAQGFVEERIDISNFKYLLSPIPYLNNFIAAELHLNSTTTDSVFFDAQISYTVGGLRDNLPFNQITAGPYITPTTQNQGIITYYTTQESNTIINYGLSPNNLNLQFRNDSLSKRHEAILTRLQPGQTYYYEVDGITSLTNNSQFQFFKTAPSIGQDTVTNIWVTGDFGIGLPTQHLVYADYLAKKGQTETDLWMWLGDNAYDEGRFGEYQRNVFDIYSLILPNHVILPSLGNHDLGFADARKDEGPYFDLFNLPKNGETNTVPSGTEAYYSYNYANIHFICLESTQNNRLRSGKMMQWLEADLKKNTAKWTIAFWHHPPYSKSSHDSDTEGQLIQMRENANPLLEKYGVDLVLCGHSHGYERSFFIDGHYGMSETFEDSKHLPSGNADGDAEPYNKTITKVGHKGTVYAVVGSSGSPYSEGSMDHPANTSNSMLIGSMLLQIDGNELHAEFISPLIPSGLGDKFNMVKLNEAVPCVSTLNFEDTVFVCGKSFNINAGDAYWNYQWNTGSTDSIITVTESGYYTLRAQQFQDCFVTDSVFIKFMDAEFAFSKTDACDGDTVNITVLNSNELLWNDSILAKTFTVNNSSPVIYKGNVDGCEVVDTLLVPFTNFPKALVELKNQDATTADAFEYKLNNRGSYDNILWNFGDGTSDTNSFGQKFYSNPGLYKTVLTLFNKDCTVENNYTINRTVVGINNKNKATVTAKYSNGALSVKGLQNGSKITIYNALGKNISESIFTDNPISLQNLASGRYFVNYTSNQKNESIGFIVP